MATLNDFLYHGSCAFERVATGFEPVGPVPAWLRHVFPEGPLPVMPQSLFLENFLIDAESFWQDTSAGRLRSGPWIETGPSGHAQPLEASALTLDGRRYLIVELLGNTYFEQAAILQRARERNLEFQHLSRHHVELRQELTRLIALLREHHTGPNATPSDADTVAQLQTLTAQASEMQHAFYKVLGEELRQPVTAMIGYARLIRNGLVGNINATQLEYLTEVVRVGDHLLGTLDHFLQDSPPPKKEPQ